MKRVALKRRWRRSTAPGRAEWKQPVRGLCEVCSKPCWHLERHHVLLRQIVKREAPELEWDLRNSMLICPDTCHLLHHTSGPSARKIPLEKVPEDAVAFTVDVLGEARAADYFRRRYGCDQTVAA